MAWAASGGVPWHGLGVSVRSDLTTDQFLKKAGLDWTVTKEPTYALRGGVWVPTGECHLYRDSDNSPLTSVTHDWNEVQNKEAFDFFNQFVEEGDMQMHTAGSLDKGRIVWALAKVNDGFEIFEQDRIESHILFTNFHKYGWSTDIRFTPIRVVCNNTLTLALAGGKKDLAVKVSHRRKFDAELVKKALGLSSKMMDEYKTMAEYLGEKRYTPENVIEYFKQVFPAQGHGKNNPTAVSKPALTALENLESQPGANFAPGSYWQAFNAATYVIDHVLGNAAETRLQSSWYGNNRSRKLNALELAKEYAMAS